MLLPFTATGVGLKLVVTVGAALTNVIVWLCVQVLLVWVTVTVSGPVSVAVMLIGVLDFTLCVKVCVPLLNLAEPVMVTVTE
jgi:hypothetical protein